MRKRDMIARFIMLGMLLILVGPTHDLWSDVLVTKSGKEWLGTVTDAGDSYVLTKSNGTKLSFPKRMVKEFGNRSRHPRIGAA